MTIRFLKIILYYHGNRLVLEEDVIHQHVNH